MSRAAGELHITQPALSRQITMLEQELGFQLLIRSGRGVVLTEEGALFLERVRTVIKTLDEGREAIRALSAVPKGRLALGISPSVGVSVGEPAVREFHETFPQVQLYVAETYSATLREWLLAGRVDVAVFYSLIPESGITTLELLEEELFVVSAPLDDDVRPAAYTLDELSRLPLILPSAPHGMHVFVDELFADVDRRKLDVHLTVDALDVQKALIKNGVGYGILPYLAVQDDVRQNVLAITRLDPPIRRKLVCAIAESRPRTVTISAMIACIEAQVARLRAGMPAL